MRGGWTQQWNASKRRWTKTPRLSPQKSRFTLSSRAAGDGRICREVAVVDGREPGNDNNCHALRCFILFDRKYSLENRGFFVW